MKRPGKYWFVLAFILFVNELLAIDYPITYLGIENGLSNNAVRCIYQDHKGFMWIGTYDGLNRYDGYTFKTFRNRFQDTTSLISNWIYTIAEDAENRLWIGSRIGVCTYNSLTENFSPAYYLDYNSKSKKQLQTDVRTIISDAAGNILIGTHNLGLLLHEMGSQLAIQIPVQKDGRSITNYTVAAIKNISPDITWLFIQDLGLYVFSRSAKTIKPVDATVKNANCMEIDGHTLWVGTNNGLWKYNIASAKYDKVFTERQGGLSFNKVVTLLFADNRELWIATDGNGINILDIANEKMRYLLPGSDPNSLTSGSVFALYEDKAKRKWIGTLRGGINIIDPGKADFHTIKHEPTNRNSLIYDFILSFGEGDNNELWIGTDGGGLSRWDRNTNRFTNYRHDPTNSHSLSNNFVTSIQQDFQKDIWFATYGGGINRYVKSNNSFVYYHCIDPATGLEDKNVWKLFEDSRKNLWACTFSNGHLYRLNRMTGRFEIFEKSLLDVITIAEDRLGNIWLGNTNELLKWNEATRQLSSYHIGKPVRSIKEDKSGNLWVGTEDGGLLLFDRKTESVAARYTTVDGLCNNAVLNILEDQKGYLWMSTFNGISKFDIHSKSFKNYFGSDGLQSNQFNFNAALALRSGEFAFGGIKGFNLFQPDQIGTVSSMPSLILTGLQVNNGTIGQTGAYVSKIQHNTIQSIEVPFNKTILTFSFTALEYSSPNKISYAWKMEGWDRDWNYAGNLRMASYTQLREGEYKFRVRCTDAEGQWNPQEIAVIVTVLPPWYRSWWAYTLYVCLLAAAIYSYLSYKTRQTKLKYEIELANLRATNEKEIAEKEREMHEKRLSFFTNVSHEFRGPLTLIINPLKEVIENKTFSGLSEKAGLNVVYRNARRLRSLVDQLLLFRKADSGADQLSIMRLNLYDLCNEVFLCFVQQAKSKGIQYDFECTDHNKEIYADREKLEIILYNLLSNALKYTPLGGRVSLKLTETSDWVEIVVQDSGVGIPEDERDNIFKKYYQAGNKIKTGFGIGLYLVKHFTEAHKGQINVKSTPGEGTIFSLSLEKGVGHFEGHSIKENVPVAEHDLLQELTTGETDIEEAAQLKTSSDTLASIVSEKPSILIVDDDAQIRKYVVQVFKGQYQLYEAHDGEHGIGIAQKYLPDIIISDIKMQGISGIELCKTVKEDPVLSHIPVILLTGSSSPETRLMGVEGGADDYITKPFEKEILVARVANLIKTRNNLQKYFFNEITLNNNTSNTKISAEYKEFLEKCIAIVEAHLEDDNFTVKDLLAEIGLSHSNVFRKVKSISGQSINVFIRFIRLRKAAEMFINTNYNINETAFQVGMKDIKYFREQFNKLFGMNPSEYIKKYRKPFGSQFSINRESLTGEDPTS